MKKILVCLVFCVWAGFLSELHSLDYVVDEFAIDYASASLRLERERNVLEKQAEYELKNITKKIPKYSKQTMKPVDEYFPVALSGKIHTNTYSDFI